MAAGVTVDFNANLARFTGAIDKATNDLTKFQTNAERTGSNVSKAFDMSSKAVSGLADSIKSLPGFGGIGASLAAIASFGAVKALVGDTISWAAAMKDAAARTGSSVESLSSLSAQAKISGVDMSTVESGIIKLNKALAGSDDESKGAAHALATIGLSVSDLKKLDPAEAYRQIAVALNGYADSGSKTALVMAVMGKNAADQIPFLKALAENGHLAAKVSAEQAEAAKQLEIAWNRTSNEGSSWSKGIVLDMMPALASLVDIITGVKTSVTLLSSGFVVGLNNIATSAQVFFASTNLTKTAEQREARIKELRDSSKRFAEAAEEDAAKQIAKVTSLRAKIDAALSGASKEQKKKDLTFTASGPKAKATSGEGDSEQAYLSRLRIQISGATGELSAYAKVLEEISSGSAVKFSAATKASALALADQVDAAKSLRDQGKDFDKYVERIASANERGSHEVSRFALKTKENIDAINEKTRELGMPEDAAARFHALSDIDKEFERTSAQIKETYRGVEAAFGDAKMAELREKRDAAKVQTLAAMDQLKAKSDELNASWEYGATKALTDYMSTAKNVAGAAESAFSRTFTKLEDALVDFAKTGKFNFKDFADFAITELLRIQIRQNIAGLASGGETNSGSTGGLIGGVLRDFLIPKFSFATGTDYVPRDMIAEIHEGEKITPRSRNQQSSLPSVTVNQTIQVDARSDQASIMAAMRQAKDAAKAEIMRSLRYGGAFA